MTKYIGWDCANKTLAWTYIEINAQNMTEIRNIANKIKELYMQFGWSHTMTRDESDKVMFAMLYDPVFMTAFCDYVSAMGVLINNIFDIISIGATDLLKGKLVRDTNEITRARALRDFLESSLMSQEKIICNNTSNNATSSNDTIPFNNNKMIPTVYIEEQPMKLSSGFNTDHKAEAVSYQLAFYFAQCNTEFVDAGLKNKIAFHDDLRYERLLDIELEKVKGKLIAVKSGDNSAPKTSVAAKKILKSARYTARKKHSKLNFLHFMKVFGFEHLLKGISATVYDDIADSFMMILARLSEDKIFSG